MIFKSKVKTMLSISKKTFMVFPSGYITIQSIVLLHETIHRYNRRGLVNKITLITKSLPATYIEHFDIERQKCQFQ